MPLTFDKNNNVTVPELNNTNSGIGLRAPHHDDVLAQKPDIGWLEVHSENFFQLDSPHFKILEQLRQDYPISLHGVGLSLGSADGLDDTHVEKLSLLIERIDPIIVSEHVSWSRIDNLSVPDLLPLPMTEEALNVIARNIDHLQNILQRPILVENPSSYLRFKDSDMGEPEFLTHLTEKTGCGLLLDINNIHVSGHNIGFDTTAYLKDLPKDRIGQIHLAGYQINPIDTQGDMFIDAHNQPVHPPVWDLYTTALSLLGDIPTLIEWDNDLPPLARLLQEAQTADTLRRRAKEQRAMQDSLQKDAPHVA